MAYVDNDIIIHKCRKRFKKKRNKRDQECSDCAFVLQIAIGKLTAVKSKAMYSIYEKVDWACRLHFQRVTKNKIRINEMK